MNLAVILAVTAPVLLNPEAWAALLAIVVPFVVSFLKRAHWADEVKVGIATAVCVLIGVGTASAQGQLQLNDVLLSALAALGAAQLHYKTWFQWLGLDAAVTRWGV